jgi:hypothetical protein
MKCRAVSLGAIRLGAIRLGAIRLGVISLGLTFMTPGFSGLEIICPPRAKF